MATVVATPQSDLVANQSTFEEFTTSDWDDLRRVARKLEGDLDVRLSSFAKLGGMLL
jgi:hypothetical protein